MSLEAVSLEAVSLEAVSLEAVSLEAVSLEARDARSSANHARCEASTVARGQIDH